MSAMPMIKECVHCHRTYTYNLSVGDMGEYCKFCGKSQLVAIVERVAKRNPMKPKWTDIFPHG